MGSRPVVAASCKTKNSPRGLFYDKGQEREYYVKLGENLIKSQHLLRSNQEQNSLSVLSQQSECSVSTV